MPEPMRIHRSQQYQRYVGNRSPEWLAKREEAFETHGRYCCTCKTKYPLVVHHLTYDRLEYETMDDLQILCWNCHDEIHGERDEDAHWEKRVDGFLDDEWDPAIKADRHRGERSLLIKVVFPRGEWRTVPPHVFVRQRIRVDAEGNYTLLDDA